jgi:hypothetical protein
MKTLRLLLASLSLVCVLTTTGHAAGAERTAIVTSIDRWQTDYGYDCMITARAGLRYYSGLFRGRPCSPSHGYREGDRVLITLNGRSITALRFR